MITKEAQDLDTYCIYANDFHLEMILLPYIKNNLQIKKFVIITEDSMQDSVKVLLDRINLSNEHKEKIYNLNWDNNIEDKMNLLKKYKYNNEDVILIVKGSLDFMEEIIQKVKFFDFSNISIVKCYSVDEVNKESINLDKSKILRTERI